MWHLKLLYVVVRSMLLRISSSCCKTVLLAVAKQYNSITIITYCCKTVCCKTVLHGATQYFRRCIRLTCNIFSTSVIFDGQMTRNWIQAKTNLQPNLSTRTDTMGTMALFADVVMLRNRCQRNEFSTWSKLCLHVQSTSQAAGSTTCKEYACVTH